MKILAKRVAAVLAAISLSSIATGCIIGNKKPVVTKVAPAPVTAKVAPVSPPRARMVRPGRVPY
jgi:hypothetical protein